MAEILNKEEDPKIQKASGDPHQGLVKYFSDKYYEGKRAGAIRKTLTSDQKKFNSALKEYYKEFYADMDESVFREKYLSKNGDPFQQKQPEPTPEVQPEADPEKKKSLAEELSIPSAPGSQGGSPSPDGIDNNYGIPPVVPPTPSDATQMVQTPELSEEQLMANRERAANQPEDVSVFTQEGFEKVASRIKPLAAIVRGMQMGNQADILTAGDKTLSEEDLKELANVQKKLQDPKFKASKEYERFTQASGFGEALKEFSQNPIQIITELTAESLTALLNHGVSRVLAGANIGAAGGTAAFPGPGTMIGAGAGAIAGLGLSSLNLEYSGSIIQSLQEAGIDVTDEESLIKGFSDSESMEKAREHALKKGIPIAVFDMMSAGLAGKVVSQPAKSLIGRAGQYSAELGMQASMGMAGEATGQSLSGEEMHAGSILAEGVGELGPGVVETMVGKKANQTSEKTTDQSKPKNNEKVESKEPDQPDSKGLEQESKKEVRGEGTTSGLGGESNKQGGEGTSVRSDETKVEPKKDEQSEQSNDEGTRRDGPRKGKEVDDTTDTSTKSDDGKSPKKPETEPQSSLQKESSWVIVDKETGKAVKETFDKSEADKVDTEKFDVLPAQEYLGKLNKKIKEESTPTKEAEETKEVVEDKADELKEDAIDLAKTPEARNAKLKEQKRDILEQMDEVENALWGDTPKEEREKATELFFKGKANMPFDEEGLKRVKDLGYEVSEGGIITFPVKDDGVFRLNYETLPDAIKETKKQFPDKVSKRPEPKLTRAEKSGGDRMTDAEKAKIRGSIEESEKRLNFAKENLEEAKKDGNKGLIKFFTQEVEKEQKIYNEAVWQNLPKKSPKTQVEKPKSETKENLPPKDLGIGIKGNPYGEEMERRGISESEERLKKELEPASDSAKLPQEETPSSIYTPEAAYADYKSLIKEGDNRGEAIAKIAKKYGQKYMKVDDELFRLERKDSNPASPEKQYSEPIGMSKKKPESNRVQPAPIAGEKPKKLRDIILKLKTGLKQTIAYSKRPIKGRRALGSYNPRNASIVIKFNNDLDVTAHELGHSLDDQYRVLADVTDPDIKAELKSFSEYGSKPPKGHPNPERYVLGEGVAEFFRGYIVNPEVTMARAPKFSEWVSTKVPKEVMTKVEEFGHDVRAFVGSTAHEQIMSNVQMDPAKAKGSLISQLRPTSKDQFSLNFWDRFSQKWITTFRPFEKAVKYLQDQRGVDKLDPSKDPRITGRLFLGVLDKMDNIFSKGLVDTQNNRLIDEKSDQPMTMEWLIEPLDHSDEAKIEQDVERVVSYMVAERTVELSDKFQKQANEKYKQELEAYKEQISKGLNPDPPKKKRVNKDILTGIGGGIFKDTEVAKKRLDEHKALPEQDRNRIEEATRRYREYSNNLLKYMVDSGRMSKEAYEAIVENNIQYVALNRVLEAAPGEEISVLSKKSGSGSLGNPKEVIKRIKGSTKTIKNPYNSLLDFAYKSIKESDRNNVMLSFRELFQADRNMYSGETQRLGEVAREASAGDQNTVKIFVDGVPEYWQLQEDVYKSVKNITDHGYKLPAFLTFLPRVLRATVTNFPVFALRNRMRDIQHRWVISKTGPLKGYDIHGNRKLKADTRDQYELFGGGQAGYYMLNEDFYYLKMKETIRDMAKNKRFILVDPGGIKILGQHYHNMISAAERATRLEEYRSAFKKAKKEGMDDYNAGVYAAYESRDLMDFAVAGEYMRVINQMVPFSNAAVRGLHKTVMSAVQNPVGFLTRWAIYSMLPSLANRMIIHWMDKDEEYEELPDYQRDMFYNFPMGEDLWLSIPKSFEIGVLASGTDRLVSKMLGHSKAFEGYAGSVARSVLPVDESIMIGPFRGPVEVMANYDFFRDKHITPPHEEGKDVDLRQNDYASRLGKAIQSVSGMDARKVDHFIKAQTSYFGDFALKLSDINRDEARNKLLDWNTTGIFRDSPMYSSKSVQWVMNTAKKKDLTRHWVYARFNVLIQDYFNAHTDTERERRAKVIRKFARDIRKAWEGKTHDEMNLTNIEGIPYDDIDKAMRRNLDEESDQ